MAEFSGWRQQASNKNLLINPRFKVNQRGQSEHLLYGYSVDGWVIYFDGKKRLKVLQDCVVLVTESIGSYFNLEQKIEGPFEKGTYTCSFLVDDFKKVSFAYVVTNGTSYKYQYAIDKNLITFTFDVENAENITSIGIQKKEELGELKIYGAKLEQGPISTLALDLMQPYTLQDYQRELMECQRYLQIYDGPLMATANTAWYASFLFDLDVEMRVIPTFSYEGDIVISDNAGETEAVFNSLKSYAGDTKRPLMRFGTPNGKLVGGHIYVVNPLKLIFSAEL